MVRSCAIRGASQIFSSFEGAFEVCLGPIVITRLQFQLAKREIDGGFVNSILDLLKRLQRVEVSCARKRQRSLLLVDLTDQRLDTGRFHRIVCSFIFRERCLQVLESCVVLLQADMHQAQVLVTLSFIRSRVCKLASASLR